MVRILGQYFFSVQLQYLYIVTVKRYESEILILFRFDSYSVESYDVLTRAGSTGLNNTRRGREHFHRLSTIRS